MTDAFTRAAAALVADANLGLDAVYRPASGASVRCRVIRYQRDPLADLGQHHVRQAGVVYSVRVADVPAPAKGDTLNVGDGFREVFDVQPDEDMITHRVSVR
jgi:hypothetical protein